MRIVARSKHTGPSGEVVIERENLKNFLKTANDLKIAGPTKLANKDSLGTSEFNQGVKRWNPVCREEADEEKEESSN